MRYRVPVERLRAVDGRELFAYAVTQGLVGSEQVEGLDIGEVEVEGDRAAADALARGERTTGLRWEFRREGDRWKLDLTALFPLTELALDQAAEEAGVPVDEFIIRSLELAGGDPVPPDIWEPPGL